MGDNSENAGFLAEQLKVFFTSLFEAYKDPNFAWQLAAWMTAFFLVVALAGLFWTAVRQFVAVLPARRVSRKALGSNPEDVLDPTPLNAAMLK